MKHASCKKEVNRCFLGRTQDDFDSDALVVAELSRKVRENLKR